MPPTPEKKKKIKKFDLSETPETLTLRQEQLPVNHEDRADPLENHNDVEFIAKTRLDMQTMPLYLYRKIHRVLNKYKTSEVFKKGDVYMEMYGLLHASEKPSDLRKVDIPFQNTHDLQDINKDLVFQLGNRKLNKSPETKENTVQDKLKDYYKNSKMLGHLFEGKHFAVSPSIS